MAVLHPDHLYKMSRMNRAFALSAIALLLVLVWMLAADYGREWKTYQAGFIRADVEQTRTGIEEAEKAIDPAALEAATKARDEAETALAARQADLDAANAEVSRLQTALYPIDQQYRFTKAQIDVLKFEVDEARGHSSPDLEKRQHEFQEMSQALEERRQALLAQQEAIEAAQKTVTGMTDARDKASALLDDLRKLVIRGERKLVKTEPDWRRTLLNLPMVDFVAPTLKVKQVVLPNIRNDVNFLEIPRVDRCMTCHVGINQKGFENLPQPYTTHPRIELFAGDDSKHPMGSFGCTTCHYGHDRGTSFHSAAHTPSTPEQKEEWEKKYHWEPLEHWDEPMLPKQFIEASCRKCHFEQVRIPGGEKINRSLDLVERYGCYGCHKIAGFEGLPKPGPSLQSIASKVTPDWTLKWLKDPRGFRPSTRMPQFWDLENVSSPEDLERSTVEAEAVSAFLFDKSARRNFPDPPVAGSAARGQQLVAQVGCMGCHQVGEDDPVTDRGGHRAFGPELNQVGSKVTPGWLFAWLKNPRALSPTTRMPDLRLTDQEAADIVAFLMTQRNRDFEAKPVPKADPAVRDKIVLEYLGQKKTAGEAATALAAMTEDQKRLFLGEKVLNRQGCFGCHLIPGYEKTAGVCVELSQWGSKYVDQLDFGLLEEHETEPGMVAHIEGVGDVEKVHRGKAAWAQRKLMQPRVFDLGRIKKPDEKLKMPSFGMSEQDAQDIVRALLSMTKEKVDPRAARRLSAAEADVEAGRRIVENRNCKGCHILDGIGGDIRAAVVRSLAKYEGRSADDADMVATTFSPPNLNNEGAKVNPEWFHGFLEAPSTIRPWLKVRMPSFHFNDADVNALITHFARKDGAPYPFVSYSAPGFGPAEKDAALKMFTPDYFNCWTCHQQGEKKPASPMDSWAPDLMLARRRLRADWIVSWLRDPQKIMPGTRMPTFYDPADPRSSAPPDLLDGDPDRQMTAIRDYIYSIGAPEGR